MSDKSHVLSPPVHTRCYFIACKDAWDALGVELVTLFIGPCSTWFKVNQCTKGNLLALELGAVKFAPRAHIIFTGLHIQKVTYTSDGELPETCW